jgi:phage-related protein (TIGR01555 family)
MAFWTRWLRKTPTTRTLDDGGRVPAEHLQGKARLDEWMNILSGIGVKGVDKRSSGEFVCEPVSDWEARELWRGDDLAKTLIEALPEDEIREGFGIQIPNDNEASSQLTDDLDTMAISRFYRKAREYERAYGGSAIWPMVNDGVTDAAIPLNETTIAKVRGYKVFEPRELIPDTWYTDPNDPKYGQPKTYRVVAINGGGGGFALQTIIHESRLVIFPGIRVSRENPSGVPIGWGDSVLTAVRGVLRDFHMTWGAIAALMNDFSQGVFKFAGLTKMLASGQDELVQKRITLMDFVRSVLRSVVVDTEDDFTRQATPMTGAPDILVQFAQRLAAAFKMPVTKLMGMSPAGMNATGESDTRGWYATVSASQEDYRPILERLIRFSLLAIDGPTNGKEPKKWRVKHRPLWTPSAKEQAETRYIIQQSDSLAIADGMYSADEVAASRWKNGEFSPDMHIDWKEREAQKLAGEAAIAAGTANVQAQALNGAQIQQMLAIVQTVVKGEVPRETGIAVLMGAFPNQVPDVAAAEKYLGPKGWKPDLAAAPVNGNGAPPPFAKTPEAPTPEPIPAAG